MAERESIARRAKNAMISVDTRSPEADVIGRASKLPKRSSESERRLMLNVAKSASSTPKPRWIPIANAMSIAARINT